MKRIDKRSLEMGWNALSPRRRDARNRLTIMIMDLMVITVPSARSSELDFDDAANDDDLLFTSSRRRTLVQGKFLRLMYLIRL